MWRINKALFTLGCLLWLTACSGQDKKGTTEPSSSSFFRGDPHQSGSRRSSANRPRPETVEHRPFDADRMGLDGYIAHRRRTHGELHSSQGSRMESFSHPACTAVSRAQRESCPLLDQGWVVAREVPGGMVVLASPESVPSPGLLRWQVLCHIAYGRVHASGDGCPLHVPGVRSRVEKGKGQIKLRLITDDKKRVKELRQAVKRLIR